MNNIKITLVIIQQETMMRGNYYWSRLAGSQYGYLDWGTKWPATDINVVWNYSLVLKIVVG
jgi:hypothetical protein